VNGEDWFVRDIADHVDLAGPGIYAWRVGGVVVYVGKASKLRSRLREYRNNVRKIADGRPYRRGKPEDFRRVHRALAEARASGRPAVFTVIESCLPGCDLLARERYWISELGPALNGPIRPGREDDR
jgi:hypothetical protein